MRNQTHPILIRELEQGAQQQEIQRYYPIMQELYPHLEEAVFTNQVIEQMKEGYRLACVEVGKKIKALAGFRVLTFLAWGRVLYIDDLVTVSEARKKGYGKKILQWVFEQAKRLKCNHVHLNSGPHRHDAHRFYMNQGMKINGYRFAFDEGLQ
jgi:GNAT superfamily N-acetyltransferase